MSLLLYRKGEAPTYPRDSVSPTVVLNVLEKKKKLSLVSTIQRQFLGNSASDLVSIPTELSLPASKH